MWSVWISIWIAGSSYTVNVPGCVFDIAPSTDPEAPPSSHLQVDLPAMVRLKTTCTIRILHIRDDEINKKFNMEKTITTDRICLHTKMIMSIEQL